MNGLPIQRLTTKSRLGIGALVALLVHLSWIFASPPGSSPDEFFHLGSSWCIYGESETCNFSDYRTDFYTKWAEVPFSLDPCFVPTTEIPATCITSENFETQALPIKNGTSTYPDTYYYYSNFVLRLGADIGIPVLRILNALISIFVAFSALSLISQSLRYSVVSAYLVLLAPQGLFILGSVNPSSWAFSGVSFGWVFLDWMITNRNNYGSKTFRFAFAMFVVTAILAFARYDSIVYFVVLNVLLVLFRYKSDRPSRLKIVGAVLSLLTFGLLAAKPMLDYVYGNFSRMISASDFWGFARYWLIHFYEIPLTSLGLNYGNHGPTGVLTPPIVGHIQFGFLSVALVLSMIVISKRQRLFFATISLVLFLVILQQVSIDGETGIYMVQGRYFLPLVIGSTGVFLSLSSSTLQLVEIRSLRVFLSTSLALAHLLALFVFVRRYSTGYDNDYRRFEMDVFKNFGLPTGWRYFDFLSPVVLLLVGSASFLILTWILLGLCDREARTDRPEHALGSSHDG